MSDRTRLPDGEGWPRPSDLERTRQEQLDISWRRADRQRAIGYEQGKAEGDTERQALQANLASVMEDRMNLRAQLATAKADALRAARDATCMFCAAGDLSHDDTHYPEVDGKTVRLRCSAMPIRNLLAATTPKEPTP